MSDLFADMVKGHNIETRYMCGFLLHGLGDTIGFKNGNWEFNYHKAANLSTVSELVYEFIDLGGVNGIDLKGWHVSDDTLYGIAAGVSMLEYGDGEKFEKFILFMKDQLMLYRGVMIIDEERKGINRYPGANISKYIDKFTETVDGRNLPYESRSGGNGAASLLSPLAF